MSVKELPDFQCVGCTPAPLFIDRHSGPAQQSRAMAVQARELARAGISGRACYLLRPDGHVGLAGTRLEADAITRYLADASIRALRVKYETESSLPAQRAEARSVRTAV